ncbi:hypothetical protein [Aneurinibacillus aneurinilyticus]|jgi:hypothetical protein|uniref:Uncharacterized protein n=2 Tax=Aneurinibacillus aneurinilyticus TaxID=1391 RepID=A0A848CUB3_ANEAE|nr:hypothetical protein [Aneurinibacillus aneurinilyticus]ERI07839.1 hypothetical protein HMPREF0083_04101 [Aneurinibacillus aneurinilyticus ATCC 12856]MCI1695098.1 hypothetical protein [Aneurinibacillus aneurinilyticus]MED0706286.1 hypothetical protein [Aneurinibacillus aneurinilyticus]MED0725302.1 hypothetical protein [Aneurinibacillus aneurinilyticus]MED0732284.1 hypothetical protein [Aneurinibacillus aneurinilyticus]
MNPVVDGNLQRAAFLTQINIWITSIVYLILFILVIYLVLSMVSYMKAKAEYRREMLYKAERLLTIIEKKYNEDDKKK